MITERTPQVQAQDFSKVSGGSKTVTAEDLSQVTDGIKPWQGSISAGRFPQSDPGVFSNLDSGGADGASSLFFRQ